MPTQTQITVLDAIRRLRLFNEKVEKLERCSFVTKVFRPDHGVTIHFGTDQPLTITKVGADEEATDALVLTLRFFFQEKDDISLRQITELYQRLPIRDEDKGKVRMAFRNIEQFLDCDVGVVFEGLALTNRIIFETFLYGDLAHVADNKRPLYEAWVKAVPFSTLAMCWFEDIVAQVLSTVFALKRFNEQTITLLKT